MPLESIHSMAFRAALAARCAGEQGKFWEMRTELFANPQSLGQTAVHALAVGIEPSKFNACMSAAKYTEDIRRDIAQAQAAGVNGTPSFMLATVGAGGELKVRRVLSGAQPFGTFKAQLDALLAAQ